MNNIVVYKEGVSLKDNFIDKKLSISTKYTLHFCTEISQVFHLISDQKANLLLYFCDQLTIQDKLQLRKIRRSSASILVCLFSNEHFAMDAWKIDMFHFDAHPIDLDKIKRVYQKYLSFLNPSKNLVLTIQLPEGTHRIPFAQIKYLHANGNYTFINYGEDKSLIVTKKLGQFEFLAEKDNRFNRIHRSLIINLNGIKSIKDKEVSFNLGQKKLEVSASLAKKLKKIITGI